MELFIAIVVAGVMTYQFYTGEVIVRNGTRRKALSRESNPGTFWFTIILQAAISVWMLLEWFEFLDTGIFSG